MANDIDLHHLDFPERLAIFFGVSFFLYGCYWMIVYGKEHGEIISWFFTRDIINFSGLLPILIAFWKETNKESGGKANLGCLINIFVYFIILIFLIKDIDVIIDRKDGDLKHIVVVLIVFCVTGIAAEIYWLQRKKYGTPPP